MRKIILASVALVFSISISAQQTPRKLLLDTNSVSPENYINFIPIPPLQIKMDVLALDSNQVLSSQKSLSMSANKKTVLTYLSNESLETTLQYFDDKGNLKYLYSGSTIAKGKYKVIIDFNKYMIEPLKDSTDFNCIGYAKIGVGLRLVASIYAKADNVNLSSLTAIAKAADEGLINGSMSYEIIGIESNQIISIIPITTEISSTLISIYLQAITVIRGKIYDSETRLYPQAIAIKHGNCNLKSITNMLIGQYDKAK
jgi:hypothetical protein